MWLDSTWRSRSHNVRNEAHLGIAEHGAPFAEGQVGGDDLPFARASRTISRPLPPVASKQEPLYLISIFIGVNVAVHAVTALWAAAKTSRADVVPATCSVPSTPRSIHPAFTASNISSAGPVRPFGMPNCSNAFAHPARGTAKAFTSRFRTSPNCSATSSAVTIEPSSTARRPDHAGPVKRVATCAPMSFAATMVDFRFVGL